MRSLVLVLSCALLTFAAEPQPKRAKNVILLIADAGGVATVHAASIYGHGAPGKLFVQSWPNLGLSETSAVGRWVTDSAAGMTAIVTGTKTKNGAISVGPNGESDVLKTVLEHAEERGLATGVLSNVTITDATPAACYAHVASRKSWGAIFLQLFTPRFGDGVDVLIGPGRPAIFKQIADLGKDVEAVSREKGRPVYSSLEDVPAEATRALVVADGEVNLKDGARRALKMLSKNDKGFFLMIESDAHTNNPELGLSRLVNFDNLIREIASTVNMEETLLLYTADHSFDLRVAGSGGPDTPILKGVEEWKAAGAKGPVRTSALRIENAHTAEEVPVLAIGPGAERVRGYMPNTNLFHIMMEAFGWSR